MESQAESMIRYSAGFVSQGLHANVVAAMHAPDAKLPGEDSVASPSMTMWRRTFPISKTIAHMLGDRADAFALFDIDVICFVPADSFELFLDSPVGQSLLIEKCAVAVDNQIKIITQYCNIALRNDEAFGELPLYLTEMGHRCEIDLGTITQECLTDFFATLKSIKQTKYSTKVKIAGASVGAVGTVAGVTITSIGIAAAPFTAGATLILSGIGLGLTVLFGMKGAAALIKTIVDLREEAAATNDKLVKVLQDLVKRIEAGGGQGDEIGRNILNGLSGGLFDQYFASCKTAQDLLGQLTVSVAKLEHAFGPVYKSLLDLYQQSLQAQGDFDDAQRVLNGIDDEAPREIVDHLVQCGQACLALESTLKDVTEAAFAHASDIAAWKELLDRHKRVIGEIEVSLSAGWSSLGRAGGKLAPTAIMLTVSLASLDYANILPVLPDLAVAFTSASADLVDTKEEFEELGGIVRKRLKRDGTGRGGSGGDGKEKDK